MDHGHAICDYEGTSYQARFWQGQGREYEDQAERIALRRLLPPTGQRIMELGAGFGRLVDLYDGYEQVILLDYATSGLREAQARLGTASRLIYVAADIYRLPLAPHSCDTVVTVRVLHHLVDVPAALQEIAKVLRPGGAYVLEYANKRNLKALVRYMLRRQTWSPFALEPYEFVALNFDFHPQWMARELRRAGFSIIAERAVSHFRSPVFKRVIPPNLLATLDGMIQPIGSAWKLAPSIFVQTHRPGTGHVAQGNLFWCPTCYSDTLSDHQDALVCIRCNAVWPIIDGIYNFKAPDQPGSHVPSQ